MHTTARGGRAGLQKGRSRGGVGGGGRAALAMPQATAIKRRGVIAAGAILRAGSDDGQPLGANFKRPKSKSPASVSEQKNKTTTVTIRDDHGNYITFDMPLPAPARRYIALRNDMLTVHPWQLVALQEMLGLDENGVGDVKPDAEAVIRARNYLLGRVLALRGFRGLVVPEGDREKTYLLARLQPRQPLLFADKHAYTDTPENEYDDDDDDDDDTVEDKQTVGPGLLAYEPTLTYRPRTNQLDLTYEPNARLTFGPGSGYNRFQVGSPPAEVWRMRTRLDDSKNAFARPPGYLLDLKSGETSFDPGFPSNLAPLPNSVLGPRYDVEFDRLVPARLSPPLQLRRARQSGRSKRRRRSRTRAQSLRR